MPVLATTPLPQDIAGLKGMVDIYYWRGLICARSWPRSFTGTPSPARVAAYTAFGATGRLVLLAADYLQRAAARDGAPHGWTWRDVMTSAQYGRLLSW